jgi:hypothetical protein
MLALQGGGRNFCRFRLLQITSGCKSLQEVRPPGEGSLMQLWSIIHMV